MTPEAAIGSTPLGGILNAFGGVEALTSGQGATDPNVPYALSSTNQLAQQERASLPGAYVQNPDGTYTRQNESQGADRAQSGGISRDTILGDFTESQKDAFIDAVTKHEGYYEGSRSHRNNNPGNIKGGSYADRHGAIGVDDGGFAIFSDPAAGRDALENLLFNTETYPTLTVEDAIARYAPAADNNDVDAYINSVVSAGATDRTTPAATSEVPGIAGDEPVFSTGASVADSGGNTITTVDDLIASNEAAVASGNTGATTGSTLPGHEAGRPGTPGTSSSSSSNNDSPAPVYTPPSHSYDDDPISYSPPTYTPPSSSGGSGGTPVGTTGGPSPHGGGSSSTTTSSPSYDFGSAYNYNRGGRVQYRNNGGMMGRHPQARGTDTIPAMLTEGEFVMDRDSTRMPRAASSWYARCLK